MTQSSTATISKNFTNDRPRVLESTNSSLSQTVIPNMDHDDLDMPSPKQMKDISQYKKDKSQLQAQNENYGVKKKAGSRNGSEEQDETQFRSNPAKADLNLSENVTERGYQSNFLSSELRMSSNLENFEDTNNRSFTRDTKDIQYKSRGLQMVQSKLKNISPIKSNISMDNRDLTMSGRRSHSEDVNINNSVYLNAVGLDSNVKTQVLSVFHKADINKAQNNNMN